VIALKGLAEPSKRIGTHQFPHDCRLTVHPEITANQYGRRSVAEVATFGLATIRPEFESPSIRLDERIGLKATIERKADD
jgi:hypothetical protein